MDREKWMRGGGNGTIEASDEREREREREREQSHVNRVYVHPRILCASIRFGILWESIVALRSLNPERPTGDFTAAVERRGRVLKRMLKIYLDERAQQQRDAICHVDDCEFNARSNGRKLRRREPISIRLSEMCPEISQRCVPVARNVYGEK